MLEKLEPVRHCRPRIRARQSPHVGPPPPPGVIRHLVGPPQSSWLTIDYCISDVRFEAKVIWHIKKRSKPCDPSGGRESAWVRGENICWPWTWGTGRWRESKGSGGKKPGEGPRPALQARTMQIAVLEMCLHIRGIFKSITQCRKTKPPTMLLLGSGHSDNSRKQTWKQQSSQASSPWFYRPGSRRTSAGMPVIYRKDELWSEQCFRKKLRDAMCRKICFSLPFGADHRWSSPELFHCFISHHGSPPLSEGMFRR